MTNNTIFESEFPDRAAEATQLVRSAEPTNGCLACTESYLMLGLEVVSSVSDVTEKDKTTSKPKYEVRIIALKI